MNRLDRNTSGLVIIAKNMASSAILYDEMKSRRIRRTYLTVVHGRIEEPGTIDAPIKRRTASLVERCVDFESGQRSVTHYAPLSYHKAHDTTALSVHLETGRTHQIRVHMAYIHHPVVGDTLYGPASCGAGPCALSPADTFSHLHALSLCLRHPYTGKPLQISAPVPGWAAAYAADLTSGPLPPLISG